MDSCETNLKARRLVVYIPSCITRDDFVEFYQKFGVINEVRLDDATRIGVVEYSEPASFQRALDALPHDINRARLSPTLALSHESSSNLHKEFGDEATGIESRICRLTVSCAEAAGSTSVVDDSVGIFLTADDFDAISSVREYVQRNAAEQKRVAMVQQNTRMRDSVGEGQPLIPSVWTDEDEIKTQQPYGFRGLTIVPKFGDIVSSKREGRCPPKLNPNIVKGSYQSVNHYLDTHFRLFREDFLRPLRDDLNSAALRQQQQKAANDTSKGPVNYKFENLRLFKNVSVEEPGKSHFAPGGDVNWVHFDTSVVDNVDWDTSKDLLYGSLVLLTHDHFRNIWFGTVASRNKESNKWLKKGWVLIRFDRDQGSSISEVQKQCNKRGPWTTSARACQPFIMAESVAFFQAYEATLRALQRVDEATMPFRDYFVSCNFSNILPPSYITEDTNWDFSNLLADSVSNPCRRVLNKADWPSAEQLGLNPAQHTALQLAITSELAVIQGPPGTGKSFIGRKIVQLLFDNRSSTGGPILVVCFSNHALDRFLESLLDFVRLGDMLRVGGQGKNEALSDYSLTSIQKRRSRVDVPELYRNAKIIGMTATGAALHQQKLRLVKPATVVIEEAAEMFEAYIIACLGPDVQHLILIGDHHQLRPIPAVHELAQNYKLDISLFERLINNECHYACLDVQHRMRPEISGPLMSHFYDSLEDHHSVRSFENIRGVTTNIAFIGHTVPEDEDDQAVVNPHSHRNSHEAGFVAALGLYFIQQGYSPSKITIITPYLGQVVSIKNELKLRYDQNDVFARCVKSIKVASVDNFQGEDNDIIILSLVRSVKEDIYGGSQIGFLSQKRRVCVAMSRAKKGFYVIGNFELLQTKTDFWKAILGSISEAGALCSELSMRCRVHNTVATAVSAGDFNKSAPEGGCRIKCKAILGCGHVCRRWCHPGDPRHDEISCNGCRSHRD